MVITAKEIRETVLELIEARAKVNKEILPGYLLAFYDCGIISFNEYEHYQKQYGLR